MVHSTLAISGPFNNNCDVYAILPCKLQWQPSGTAWRVCRAWGICPGRWYTIILKWEVPLRTLPTCAPSHCCVRPLRRSTYYVTRQGMEIGCTATL